MVDGLGGGMFGRPLRLRVLLWVRAREGVFFQSEAARGVDYSGVSAVAKELETLEVLGMVRKYGRPSNTGRQNYVRTESPWWGIIDTASAALRGEAGEEQVGKV
jgi:hypothetical protein